MFTVNKKILVQWVAAWLMLTLMACSKNDDVAAAWQAGAAVNSAAEIMGSWKCNPKGGGEQNPPKELSYDFNKSGNGSFSIVTRDDTATGSSIQYKVMNSKLYIRTNLGLPVADGNWGDGMEVKLFNGQLLMKSEHETRAYNGQR